MIDFEKLNQEQRAAVLDDNRACVVNANVGSGKTTVLISKIRYLHEEKQISYSDMVVLTFTNKAANEIKKRLTAVEPDLAEQELKAFGTFHSVALYLLKEVLPVEQIGFTKDFFVMEPEEELELAQQLILTENLTIKYKNRLKKRLETETVLKYQDDLFRLKELLEQEKIKENKMSFSDLIYYASMLLKEQKRTEHGEKPRWIIIDEVQDSDRQQLEFIEAMHGEDTRLFAVGDPNQVIYSWRGSELNVFYALKEKYQARELSLPVNYRSNEAILRAAKCFVQNGNPLTGTRESGNPIIIKRQYDSFQEAGYLADKIKGLHNDGVPYQEIAIFYRLQSQSEMLENVFQKNDIPYEVSIKQKVTDIPVLNWLLKVLRFSVNEKDITSAVYALSDKNYGEMTQKAATKTVKEHSDKSKLLQKMYGFKKTIREMKAEHSGNDVNRLYTYFDLDQYLHPTRATYMEDKSKVEWFLRVMFEEIHSMRQKEWDETDCIRAFLNSAALFGMEPEQNRYSAQHHPPEDKVRLMTLHASKGLEFSHVFIIGVNNGLLPLQGKSFDEEDEERRLFFVGITRAKDYLEMSYYTNPDTFRTQPGESRFLRMISPKLVERVDEDDTASGASEGSKVDLQALKKEILQEKMRGEAVEKESEKESAKASGKEDKMESTIVLVKENPSQEQRKVYHKKYGLGVVQAEDDMMIQVIFDGYGEKEFIKAFSELEER